MDYVFSLSIKNRSETEILKDLIVDLKKQCHTLEIKCDKLAKENKMARQCNNVNERTICQLQKQVATLQDDCNKVIAQELKKYKVKDHAAWFWKSNVSLNRNDFSNLGCQYNGMYYSAVIVWNQSIGNNKAMQNQIQLHKDNWQFQIKQKAVYRVQCNTQTLSIQQFGRNNGNVNVAKNIAQIEAKGKGDQNSANCTRFRLAIMINNQVASATLFDRSKSHWSVNVGSINCGKVESVQVLDVNNTISVNLLDMNGNHDIPKAFAFSLCIEQIQ